MSNLKTRQYLPIFYGAVSSLARDSRSRIVSEIARPFALSPPPLGKVQRTQEKWIWLGKTRGQMILKPTFQKPLEGTWSAGDGANLRWFVKAERVPRSYQLYRRTAASASRGERFPG